MTRVKSKTGDHYWAWECDVCHTREFLCVKETQLPSAEVMTELGWKVSKTAPVRDVCPACAATEEKETRPVFLKAFEGYDNEIPAGAFVRAGTKVLLVTEIAGDVVVRLAEVKRPYYSTHSANTKEYTKEQIPEATTIVARNVVLTNGSTYAYGIYLEKKWHLWNLGATKTLAVKPSEVKTFQAGEITRT